MDQQLIAEIICKAAREVFSTMLNREITIGTVTTTEEAPEVSQDVVAIIGITGDWTGTGLVGCDPNLACRIASLMLMTEYAEVVEDVLDAMAEMANMIFGNVKTDLEERLGGLALSIPTVIYGHNFSTRTVGHRTWMLFPVSMEEGKLELRFFLVPSGQPPASNRPIPRRDSMALELSGK